MLGLAGALAILRRQPQGEFRFALGDGACIRGGMCTSESRQFHCIFRKSRSPYLTRNGVGLSEVCYTQSALAKSGSKTELGGSGGNPDSFPML